MKSYERNIGGQKVLGTFRLPSEIKDISKINVTQVSGICFNDAGKILVISSKQDKWGLPGGKPEKGENYITTLKREVLEEASVEIENIQPVAIMEINFPNNPNKMEGDKFFQIRCIASIKSVHELSVDSATGILFKREFIPYNKFKEYIKWAEADDLLQLSMEKFKKDGKKED